MSHQSDYCSANRLKGPCRAPCILQNIQANFTSLEMHIWVENFGQKSNLWRQQRILLWNCKCKLKNTTFIRCFRRALDKSSPLEYV
jgi:hypothetical protein